MPNTDLQSDDRRGYSERQIEGAWGLPRLTHPRPDLRAVERFAVVDLLLVAIQDLLTERLDVLFVVGEPMITRTEATRFLDRPSLRPISSGEGTPFVTR